MIEFEFIGFKCFMLILQKRAKFVLRHPINCRVYFLTINEHSVSI